MFSNIPFLSFNVFENCNFLQVMVDCSLIVIRFDWDIFAFGNSSDVVTDRRLNLSDFDSRTFSSQRQSLILWCAQIKKSSEKNKKNCLLYKRWKCVCVYVCLAACFQTHKSLHPKFGMGSSFHPGSAPSQGATQNVGPRPCTRPHPLLLLRSICTGLFHNCIVK